MEGIKVMSWKTTFNDSDINKQKENEMAEACNL